MILSLFTFTAVAIGSALAWPGSKCDVDNINPSNVVRTVTPYPGHLAATCVPAANALFGSNCGAIISPNGDYIFLQQPDGNLVLYDNNGNHFFATGVYAGPTTHAIFQTDGNLVQYDGNGKPLWASGTWNVDAEWLCMQDDRNVAIYNNLGTMIWSTQTATD